MLFPSELSYVVTILSVLLIVGMSYSGYKEGFVVKLLELCSTVGCILIAWFCSGPIADKVALMPKDYVSISGTSVDEVFYKAVNETVVFIALFILFRIVIIFIRPAFRNINWIPFVGIVNRIMGFLMGFTQAFIIVVVVSVLFSTPLFANGKQVLAESKLIYIYNLSRSVVSLVSEEYNEMESIQKMQMGSEIIEESDVKNIKNWLDKYNFDNSEQTEIINTIKMRNE